MSLIKYYLWNSNVTNGPGAADYPSGYSADLWRSDEFRDNPDGKGLEWGIGHARKGGDLYLTRFDCNPRQEPIHLIQSPQRRS